MQVQIVQRIAEYNKQREPGEPEMTQRRLAGLLRVTEGAVSLWANGKRPVPVRVALRMARLLGCRVEDLFTPTDLHNVNRDAEDAV